MRRRAGRGQTFAFDAEMQVRVEKFRSDKGYYPALREIGESYKPSISTGRVKRSLLRLSAAGALTREAERVYNPKKAG